MPQTLRNGFTLFLCNHWCEEHANKLVEISTEIISTTVQLNIFKNLFYSICLLLQFHIGMIASDTEITPEYHLACSLTSCFLCWLTLQQPCRKFQRGSCLVNKNFTMQRRKKSIESVNMNYWGARRIYSINTVPTDQFLYVYAHMYVKVCVWNWISIYTTEWYIKIYIYCLLKTMSYFGVSACNTTSH